MFKDFTPADREHYITFSKAFYQLDAVLHDVPEEYYHRTFDEILGGSPYVRGLMIREGEDIAGYALLALTWSNEAGGLSVLLDELYILPAFQGKGLGGSLMEFVEEQYSGEARRFRLEVTASNRDAMRLYERKGYQLLDYVQMIKDTPS